VQNVLQVNIEKVYGNFPVVRLKKGNPEIMPEVRIV